MLLADSEYRHELEANIAPFKGLLLGLFLLRLACPVNTQLLMNEPVRILAIVTLLMLAKALVLFPLARIFGISDNRGPISLAVVLSQGGEFAFVLFALVAREGILDTQLIDQLILAVAVSMLLTPVFYLLNEWAGRRQAARLEAEFDEMEDEHNQIIIAGFGRFGQIVGRMLRIVDRPFTALEIDSSQVDVVRRYGSKVFYGDASKLDLLRAAGAAHARVFVLAIDDIEASVNTARTVMRHFPNLTIIARARNRRHEHFLRDLGITQIYRETFLSSLALSERVLCGLGFDEQQVLRIAHEFRASDERLMQEQQAVHQTKKS